MLVVVKFISDINKMFCLYNFTIWDLREIDCCLYIKNINPLLLMATDLCYLLMEN